MANIARTITISVEVRLTGNTREEVERATRILEYRVQRAIPLRRVTHDGEVLALVQGRALIVAPSSMVARG